MKVIKHFLLISIGFFILLMFLFLSIQKLFGYDTRMGYNHNPFTWDELLDSLPQDILITSLISILLTLLILYIKDSEHKEISYQKSVLESSNDPVLDEIIQDALQSGKKEEKEEKKEDVQKKPLDTKADSK